MSSGDVEQVRRSRVDLDVIVGTYASENAVRLASRRKPSHLILSTGPRFVGIDGIVVHMRSDPYRILCALIGRRGNLLTKFELAEILWSHRADGGPGDKTMDVLMLQVKAAAAVLGICIETVWGSGWRAHAVSRQSALVAAE